MLFQNDLALIATLMGNHQVDVKIHALDLSHRFLQDLSGRMTSGQIDFDAEKDPNRELSLDILDPLANTVLSSSNPLDGGPYLSKMLAIYYCVGTPDGSRWWDIPVFCGPITNLNRDDSTLFLNAAGKETLGYGSMRYPKTFSRGTLVRDAIYHVLVTIMGENPNRMEIPWDFRALQQDTTLDVDTTPWDAIKEMYYMLNHEVFYDGSGILRCRPLNTAPVLEITEKMMLDRPKFGYDPSNFANMVRVILGDGANAVWIDSYAPISHPLSAQSLGRANGVTTGIGGAIGGREVTPRYYRMDITDPTVGDVPSGQSRADQEMAKALIVATNVEFQSIPFPLMEERDRFVINIPGVYSEFQFRKSSISLSDVSPQSWGYNKRTSKPTQVLKVPEPVEAAADKAKPKKGKKNFDSHIVRPGDSVIVPAGSNGGRGGKGKGGKGKGKGKGKR